MHPLDLSPKTNPSHFKSVSGDLRKIDNPSLLSSKDNSKKAMCTFGNKREKDLGKRGRPRADKLTILMVEGSSSRSKIRCNKCGRVFPREKSLQAHMRTHTGERPYPCDFPGCSKAFCQSGQLKTHQRLHTGEKPFICNVDGCSSRFTHANRHCSSHPNAGLRRAELNLQQVSTQLNQDLKTSPEKQWLERYIRRYKERLNPKEYNNNDNNNNTPDTVALDMRRQTDLTKPFKKRLISSSTITITSTNPISIIPSPSPQKDEHKNVFFTSALPRIQNFTSVSSSSRLSPTAFPVSPPMAHQATAKLTPLTPRHPGSASSTSSRSSSSSSSTLSSSSSAGAVRDLSSFMQTPTKPALFHAPVIDSSRFDSAHSYCSPIITDHTSHSPYYGQILPPPPQMSRSQPLILNYNTPVTPVKTDKDRYISALALIELSKG